MNISRGSSLCGYLLAVGMVLPGVAHAATVELVAALSGGNEVAGGDPDGSGSFSAKADPDAGKLCYSLSSAGIDPATMAHIHVGAAGTNGGPVVMLAASGDGCVAVDSEKLKAIVANPAGYYVNVHNAAFPAGAVRGQLAGK